MYSKSHYVSEKGRAVSGLTIKDPMEGETDPGMWQGEEIVKIVRRADFREPGKSEFSSWS